MSLSSYKKMGAALASRLTFAGISRSVHTVPLRPLTRSRCRPSIAPPLGRTITTTQKRYSTMSDLYVDLEAPNGVKYKQPTGLFINNEFVPGSSTQKITSIDPA